MASQASYDATTGQWSFTGGGGSGSSTTTDTGSKAPSASSSTPSTTSDNKDSSTSGSEETYNEIDYYNLQGTLNYIATEETIKLKAGHTVTLQGLGKYLSGDYYLLSVSRVIDSSGYSHSAEVIRVNFGSKSIKKTTTTTPKSVQEQTPEPQSRTYTVVKGDCLWNIAKKFYGNGADYTKIYNANKGVIGGNPNLIYPGQVLVIP